MPVSKLLLIRRAAGTVDEVVKDEPAPAFSSLAALSDVAASMRTMRERKRPVPTLDLTVPAPPSPSVVKREKRKRAVKRKEAERKAEKKNDNGTHTNGKKRLDRKKSDKKKDDKKKDSDKKNPDSKKRDSNDKKRDSNRSSSSDAASSKDNIKDSPSQSSVKKEAPPPEIGRPVCPYDPIMERSIDTHGLLHVKRPDGWVGSYSSESRKERIRRFHMKRGHRVWKKMVKYDVRKNFADSRLRVQGRFVKKGDEALMRELMSLT